MKGGEIASTVHLIKALYWTHTSGLLFAEGGAMQQLIGPGYLFISCTRCEFYDPRPHVKDLVMATVHSVPPGFDLLGVFSELHKMFG